MKKKLTKKEKKRAERDAKKQKARVDKKRNLLSYTLGALIRCQKDLPTVDVLQKALKALHHLGNKIIKEFDVMDKMLSAAIAYKQLGDLSYRAAAAIEQDNQILILDKEQNLILQVSVNLGKIEYQGIVFTLEQVRAACSQVRKLKAKKARKLAEQCLATFLAEIPAHLEVKIKALQEQAEQHWDKLSLLNTVDLKFLESYQRPIFNFYHVLDIDIQTQSQMNDWISGWIGRVEAAIAAPSLIDTSILTILKLIASSPKYGIQTYAMWLGHSKAKSLDDKKLDKNFRAALGDNTIVAIAAKIEACIEHQWLTITAVGTHHLPVLVVTKKGKKVLKLVKPTKQAAQLTVNIHSHLYWLEQIQVQEQTAYVNFLNSPQSIANMASWTQDEVVAMQRLLNERLKAWQVLANWKLSKHPIKYKPLQRLLC